MLRNINNIALTLCLFLCTLGLNHSASAYEPIVTFDVKGAGTSPGQGTFGIAINPAGVIVGYYIDANNVYHGFVRAPWGATTSFDIHGAGTAAGQGTLAESINPWGTITGYYTDASGLSHGFVRAPWGAVATFDAPGAGIPAGPPCSFPVLCSTGTQSVSINPVGTVAGQYVDTNGVFHGFVRTPWGIITTFDAPNAGTSASQGTYVTFGGGINPSGTILGGYADADGVFHGMVRAPDGAITSFDPPSSAFTDPAGINAGGTVAGLYVDANSIYHGFVRVKNGDITTFDVEDAGTGASQGTLAYGLNDLGAVVGPYIDGDGVYHGFLRAKDRTVTEFDVKGAGTGSGQGTVPVFINNADAITGYYVDAEGIVHGFLRKP